MADRSAQVARIAAIQTLADSRAIPSHTPARLPTRTLVAQAVAVMPYEVWKDRSTRAGKRRSPALLGIDEAVIHYQTTISKDVLSQRLALDRIHSAIEQWEKRRVTANKDPSKSSRWKTINKLRRQVSAKRREIREDLVPSIAPKKVGRRSDFAFDLYNRVRTRTQNILAIETPRASPAANVELVAPLADLREEARSLAHHPVVVAIWDAMSVLIAIAECHLAAHVSTTNHKDANKALGVYKVRFKKSLKPARAYTQGRFKTPFPPRIVGYLDTVERDAAFYEAVSGRAQPDEPDFSRSDLYGNTTGLIGEALNAIGMQGTGGKGNEGLEDYWKTTLANTDAKQHAANIMSGLHDSENTAAMDKLSGGADVSAGMMMSLELGAEIGRLMAIIKYTKGSKDPEATWRRRDAIARLILLTTAGSVAAIGKMLGGALTAARGHGTLPDSNMFQQGGARELGVDMSTDVKLVGDAAGALISAVNSVRQTVHTIHNIIKRGKTAKKYKKTGGEHVMDAFDSVSEVAGTASSVANSYSIIYKLYAQIAGGGQIATENIQSVTAAARGTVDSAPVIPILGLIKGVLDLIGDAIKIGMTAKAAANANKKFKSFAAEGTQALLGALQVTKESFRKQLHRAIISIIHSAGAITAGALNVSGMGAGIGAIINIGSMVAQIVQIGARKIKQRARDKKGKTWHPLAGGQKLTNLEMYAEDVAAGKSESEQFVSYALYKAKKRQKVGAKNRSRGYDIDKTTVNKEYRYRSAAIEIMRSSEDRQKWFFRSLGLNVAMQKIDKDDSLSDAAKVRSKMKALIGAFKKR